MGDGLLDIRKDSQYITVSYNHFSHHNKAFGIGWTSNVKTQAFSGPQKRIGTVLSLPADHQAPYAGH
jgi:pectate lyase